MMRVLHLLAAIPAGPNPNLKATMLMKKKVMIHDEPTQTTSLWIGGIFSQLSFGALESQLKVLACLNAHSVIKSFLVGQTMTWAELIPRPRSRHGYERESTARKLRAPMLAPQK